MQVIDYTFEKIYIDLYAKLVGDIYRAHPFFARSRSNAARRMFDKNNPFLRFGAWKNYLIMERGRPVAHISAVLDKRLLSSIGLVGYFDAVKEPEYANKAFDAARGYLAGRKKKLIRGPVDLTTWNNFRVSYPENKRPFILEPFTRGYYRDLFEGYGFQIVQSNISTIVKTGRSGLSAYRPMYASLQKEGFVFEAVDDKDLSRSLPEIYKLAAATFKDTWCFVKISFEEFLYDFQGSAAPYLLYLARNKKGKAVAFFLGASDVCPGGKRRIILKTMGVLQEYQKLGIARALFYLAYLKAKEENASELIFSTMRSDNEKIRGLTGSAQSIYRRYCVYEMAI